MKTLKSIILTSINLLVISVLSTFSQVKIVHFNNSKLIHVLTDKKGNLLGKVYISDFRKEKQFKGDIFYKLTIVKREKGKLDTLYFINNITFKNINGIEATVEKKKFYGYLMERKMNDGFDIFIPARNGVGASDAAIISWNYSKKIFELVQSD